MISENSILNSTSRIKNAGDDYANGNDKPSTSTADNPKRRRFSEVRNGQTPQEGHPMVVELDTEFYKDCVLKLGLSTSSKSKKRKIDEYNVYKIRRRTGSNNNLEEIVLTANVPGEVTNDNYQVIARGTKSDYPKKAEISKLKIGTNMLNCGIEGLFFNILLEDNMVQLQEIEGNSYMQKFKRIVEKVGCQTVVVVNHAVFMPDETVPNAFHPRVFAELLYAGQEAGYRYILGISSPSGEIVSNDITQLILMYEQSSALERDVTAFLDFALQRIVLCRLFSGEKDLKPFLKPKEKPKNESKEKSKDESENVKGKGKGKGKSSSKTQA
jgi:hypothetical protein